MTIEMRKWTTQFSFTETRVGLSGLRLCFLKTIDGLTYQASRHAQGDPKT